MTAAELAAFVAEVRAQVNAIFDRLADLDCDTLPAPVRAVYDDVRRQAIELRTMTEAHVIGLLGTFRPSI